MTLLVAFFFASELYDRKAAATQLMSKSKENNNYDYMKGGPHLHGNRLNRIFLKICTVSVNRKQIVNGCSSFLFCCCC